MTRAARVSPRKMMFSGHRINCDKMWRNFTLRINFPHPYYPFTRSPKHTSFFSALSLQKPGAVQVRKHGISVISSCTIQFALPRSLREEIEKKTTFVWGRRWRSGMDEENRYFRGKWPFKHSVRFITWNFVTFHRNLYYGLKNTIFKNSPPRPRHLYYTYEKIHRSKVVGNWSYNKFL